MPVVAAIGAGIGALGGSAVAGAALSAGVGLYNASQQRKVAKDTNAANQQALAQSLAAQQQALGRIEGLQQPFQTTGVTALDALARQFGLSNEPDYAAYTNNYPDLAAAAQQAGMSPEEFGRQHWAQYGQSEGRDLPTPQPQGPPAWAPPTDYGQAPTLRGSAFAPSGPDLSAEGFQRSPLYNLGLAEGQANLNSNFGARGLLRSGAAIKGAVDFARENVKNNFSTYANLELQRAQQAQSAYNADRAGNLNEYSALTNQFNNNRNFDYGRYTDGLGYQTDRYDNNTRNLFGLAGMGQDAAGAVGNAATAFANNAGNIYQGQAASTSQRAQDVGAANAGLVGTLGGIGQNLFGRMGSRTSPLSAVSPYGYGSNIFQPANIQTNVPGLMNMPQVSF
jgi:hypothetical protein